MRRSERLALAFLGRRWSTWTTAGTETFNTTRYGLTTRSATTAECGHGSPAPDAGVAWRSSISAMRLVAGSAYALGIRRSPKIPSAAVGGERAESSGSWDAMLTTRRGDQAACADVHTNAYVMRGGGKRSFATTHWPHLWRSATTYSFDSPADAEAGRRLPQLHGAMLPQCLFSV